MGLYEGGRQVIFVDNLHALLNVVNILKALRADEQSPDIAIYKIIESTSALGARCR